MIVEPGTGGSCLPTQKGEIRRMAVQSLPRQIVLNTLSQKYLTQKGLAEWLKERALSSNPSTTKK
jgi:hypothetical protein